MNAADLGNEKCLSPDERREVAAAWQAMQPALQSMDELIEQAEMVNCQELYEAFQRLTATFDAFERTIMRAQQLRLLQAAQHR